MLGARARCDEMTNLPWRAPPWVGTSPTLAHLETIMIPVEMFPLFHYEINAADVELYRRRPHISEQRAAWSRISGQAYPEEDVSVYNQGGLWLTLCDLDWNLFLRVIFTRFLVLAYGPGSGGGLAAEWTVQRVAGILERLQLLYFTDFCQQLWLWVVSNPAALYLVRASHDDRMLRELSRAGAWLLDSVHTVILVIMHGSDNMRSWTTTRPPVYIAVGNTVLFQMAQRLFHANEQVLSRNRNYVGNVMEHLAWLAFEAGREDLIVALACWLAREWRA